MDETLLDSVDADPTRAVLRTYGWAAPTLSLGYFQRAADAAADPRWRGVPTVRRPSGGGAIWHDRELTYALVVPRSWPAARRAAGLYRAVHEALAAVLHARGLAVGMRGEIGGDIPPAHPFLCFTDLDPADIVLDGAKVVGSAQRRRPAAVLQHGSVLLARSPATPELPGIAELAGLAIDAPSLSDILRCELPAALGLAPRDDRATAGERLRAATLADRVYRDPAWTGRR